MKTQLSKPARSKARYTDQYKQEALELWRASGRSAAISNSQNASLAENAACRATPYISFRLETQVQDCIRPNQFVKSYIAMKTSATVRSGKEPCRVVVVGDTCVSEEGIAAIVGRDKRYHICGSAHGFYEGCELIRKHQPDVLLIEPFLEDRDGIRLIKDLATEFPRIRILIVTRQSERIYAERALHAGAAGYWMKNGSAEEFMRALGTVAAGEVYVSPAINALAIQKFAHREMLPDGIGVLTDRELAIFALVAAEQGVGRIATKLGISRTTVETHCEHIKLKLGYHNAEALKQGAHKLLGRA